MVYCLDTNVVIALMRNRPGVIERLRTEDVSSIKISEIVRAELQLGCLKSQQPSRERQKVAHTISPFELLPFCDDAVEHYASIRAELENQGNCIGPNDLLIAATARAIGAVMVTANVKEFKRVPGLVVEDRSES